MKCVLDINSARVGYRCSAFNTAITEVQPLSSAHASSSDLQCTSSQNAWVLDVVVVVVVVAVIVVAVMVVAVRVVDVVDVVSVYGTSSQIN